MDYHHPFVENEYFHVFNRANGSEQLFINEENYRFFLSKVKHYILPVADLCSYALLPNHYHFLIRIKPLESLENTMINKQRINTKTGLDYTSQSLGNLQNSYAKSFNKVYHRKGSLFMNAVRRVMIQNEEQFIAAVFYIHSNPVHHGLCNYMYEWKFSSFNSFYSEKSSLVSKHEVIDFFGSKRAFDEFHRQPIEIKNRAGSER